MSVEKLVGDIIYSISVLTLGYVVGYMFGRRACNEHVDTLTEKFKAERTERNNLGVKLFIADGRCEQLNDALELALEWVNPGGSNGEVALPEEIAEYQGAMSAIRNIMGANLCTCGHDRRRHIGTSGYCKVLIHDVYCECESFTEAKDE